MAAKKLKNEDIRHRVVIDWEYRGTPEVLEEVDGFKLENDTYFFYFESGVKTEEGDPLPTIRTVWLHHPNLVGISITPYHKKVK
jgi:hypothetical protein